MDDGPGLYSCVHGMDVYPCVIGCLCSGLGSSSSNGSNGSVRMSNRMDAKVESSTASDPCGCGPKPAQRACTGTLAASSDRDE